MYPVQVIYKIKKQYIKFESQTHYELAVGHLYDHGGTLRGKTLIVNKPKILLYLMSYFSIRKCHMSKVTIVDFCLVYLY